MIKFERIVFVQPAYDRRNPDPKKNYGIHGAHLVFVLKGVLGAVEFDIGTNWYLPHVVKELRTKESFSDGKSWFEPRPYSIGYQAPNLCMKIILCLRLSVSILTVNPAISVTALPTRMFLFKF